MTPPESESDWLPLDNAAKIYPSTASLRSPAEFRLAFSLEDPVRLLWLQRALKHVMPRFPYFQVYLRRGFFWYYLQRTPAVPEIQLLQNVPIGIIPLTGRTSPLLRVSASGRTVAVDFSHILTDGSGGFGFLLALAAGYLSQAGLLGSWPEGVMDPESQPDPEEYEDAHRKYFPESAGSPGPMKQAWHMEGTHLRAGHFRLLEAEMPASQVHGLAGASGASVTEYLSALYVFSLARMHHGSGRKIIRLEVPVDMRRILQSKTMRNFSLYMSPQIDLSLGDWSFDEILKEVHHSIQLMKSSKQLGRQIFRNVGSELNPLVRFLPLFMKDLLLSLSYSRLGEGLHSGVLSNLGSLAVPPAMESHIKSFSLHINPNRVMKKSCGVLSYRGILHISFAGVLEETEFERLFLRRLASCGVDVTVREVC